MAESKKAMEMRHARTLSKIAKEEASEAKEYRKGGKTNSDMLKMGRNMAKIANQKSPGRKQRGV